MSEPNTTHGSADGDGQPQGTARHDPYAALRLPNYRLFAASGILSIIGGQAQGIAIAWQVYRQTGSALSLGFIGGIQVVPLLLLALPAGHLSDLISRKRILLTTQSLLVVWGLLLATISYYGQGRGYLVPAIFGVIFLNAVTSTFARPARAALLPQMVPARLFSNAATWNSSISQVASMVGPALGGLIVAYGGPPLAYLFNAVLIMGCFALTLSFPDRRPAHDPARPRAVGLAALLAGVAFVWRSKLLLSTMTLDLFAVLLGGATYLLPVFAERLGSGPVGYGWLRAAPSFGALGMALMLAHRAPMKRAGRALLLAVAGFGVATIVFGLSRNYALSFAMLALTGVCDNLSVIVRHTLVQLTTPDEMRGRVSAVNQVFIGSSNELGGLESGVTAALIGPVGSVVLGGLGTLATVAVIAAAFPQLRRFGSLQDARPEPFSPPVPPTAPVLSLSQPADAGLDSP